MRFADLAETTSAPFQAVPSPRLEKGDSLAAERARRARHAANPGDNSDPIASVSTSWLRLWPAGQLADLAAPFRHFHARPFEKGGEKSLSARLTHAAAPPPRLGQASIDVRHGSRAGIFRRSCAPRRLPGARCRRRRLSSLKLLVAAAPPSRLGKQGLMACKWCTRVMPPAPARRCAELAETACETCHTSGFAFQKRHARARAAVHEGERWHVSR
jgi:hypothetical protein